MSSLCGVFFTSVTVLKKKRAVGKRRSNTKDSQKFHDYGALSAPNSSVVVKENLQVSTHRYILLNFVLSAR